MISQTAEYSLRAVLLLASRQGQPMTTSQIAAEGKIPGGYLSKVLQLLVRAGLVSSQRGVNGGFLLGLAPETLTLMDVVRTVDPSHRIRCCPLDIPEHINLCPLHRRLDAAVAAAERELCQATVADLVAEQQQPPLCQQTHRPADASTVTIKGCALSSRSPARPQRTDRARAGRRSKALSGVEHHGSGKQT